MLIVSREVYGISQSSVSMDDVSGVESPRTVAVSSGLDPDFAEKFLGFMVREVIRHHEDIKAEYDEGSCL